MRDVIWKLQKILLALLIIFLPSQLGAHFWPEWALVNGVRIDYFSPTLFLTDILILGAIVLEGQSFLKEANLHELATNLHKSKGLLLGCCVIGLLVYLNVVGSLSPAVSIYKWIKVFEFVLLGWTVLRFKGKGLAVNDVTPLLLVPVFYESILAIWQFVLQGSVGGIWYWLGERSFDAATIGSANAYINGNLVLRPYGTLPHPNVLGGFLAIVLPLVLALRLRSGSWPLRLASLAQGKLRFLHNSRIFHARGTKLLVAGGWWLVLILGYIALFLSMSRVAILVGVVASGLVALPYLKSLKTLIIPTACLLIAGVGWLGPRIGSLWVEREPIVVREQLNYLAINSWRQSPIVGTGLGTSPMYAVRTTDHRLQLKNYALVYQPTHNIYLLVLAETGLAGLICFGGLMFFVVKRLWSRKNFLLLTPLVSILVLEMVDHYFLTLQQGQILFILFLALSGSALF